MMMRCRFGILFLLLLVCHLSVTAQRGGTDSLRADTTMGDTIVVGAEDPLAKTHLDTSYAAAESGDSAQVEEPRVLRTLPDSTVLRWQRDPDFAYANDSAYWHWRVRQQQTGRTHNWLEDLLLSKGFRYTVFVLLAALLLYAIVRIAIDNNMNLFYRRRGKRSGGASEDADGLPEEDLDERINHYLQAGDRRQAIRYLYRKTLHLLSERQLIRLHADATNQEYLQQLKGTQHEEAFRFLTGAYEKVWYGELIPGEMAFGRLHNYFINTHKSLGA